MELSQGTKIQKYLKFLEKTQWWKPEQLEDLQNKKLRALIKHAYRNVPYYYKLFKENGLKPDDIKTKEDLQILPFLTKDIIRKNLPDLKARNISKYRFMKHRSSGSTGEPLTFYLDKNAYTSGWAQTFRCWGWAGYKLGDPYVKMMIHRRESSIKKLQDYLMKCTFVCASNINDTTFMKQIDMIRRSKPKIIRGYVSWLYLLADCMKKAETTGIQPKAIMTTGEPLYPNFRKTIESQFNCKIFDGYGGEEIPVSFECEEHEEYHICEETTVAEFIKNNEPVSAGELGDIVLTSLDNYAMPFIRYKIKDLGIPSDSRCNCGRGLSTMKAIVGRDTDIVSTPNGNFLIGMFFVALFEDMDVIDQFQVIQESLYKLTIKLVKKSNFREQDLDHIKKSLRKAVGEEMELNFVFVDEISLAKSGKKRLVISEIPPKFNE